MEQWRRQIKNAEQRENATERRCQDLEGMVPRATQPLLRQIEALQRSQDEQVRLTHLNAPYFIHYLTSRLGSVCVLQQGEAFQGLEASLRTRLQAAEAHAAVAAEKASSAREQLSSELVRTPLFGLF
eukprot:COSAG05_NODE_29_length_29038_cov_1237.466985_6_plen_127_part_00